MSQQKFSTENLDPKIKERIEKLEYELFMEILSEVSDAVDAIQTAAATQAGIA